MRARGARGGRRGLRRGPDDVVAEIDGAGIEKSTFDHWLAVSARAGGRGDAGARQDRQLRDQVLQQLISFEWLEGEAEARGIEVSDAEVEKSFEQQRKETSPKGARYRRFLEKSGQTPDDIRQQVCADVLAMRIRTAITRSDGTVADARIADFYARYRQRFATPERRDVRIVLSKTRARAQQARRALELGGSWTAVSRRSSIDEASGAQGGKLAAQPEGTLERALDEAVFKAGRGRLSGPVKTRFGFYVFEVTKVIEASQQTLAQAKETIRQALLSQRRQAALAEFSEEYSEKWRERTECGEGYMISQCGNGPDPTATPRAARTAPPASRG